MKKTFKVSCTYSCWGQTLVCLDIPDGLSPEEIKKMVLDYASKNIENLELPDKPEYIEDSFDIDMESLVEEC